MVVPEPPTRARLGIPEKPQPPRNVPVKKANFNDIIQEALKEARSPSRRVILDHEKLEAEEIVFEPEPISEKLVGEVKQHQHVHAPKSWLSRFLAKVF